jgi:hypothetical protein
MEAEDQNIEETSNAGNGFAVTGLILGCSALVLSILSIIFSAISWAKGKRRGG